VNFDIAPDSNILTYFLQANSGFYEPEEDPQPDLAAERVAVYRLFLYGPKLVIVPSVLAEAQKIPATATRDEHVQWIYYHFREVLPEWLDQSDVTKRQVCYSALHPKAMDCKAVAEAESAGINRFITFDGRLRKRLAGKTEKILIQTPTECWAELAVPKGAQPNVLPAPEHPLANVSWWRW
jgi:hypothetical protein